MAVTLTIKPDERQLAALRKAIERLTSVGRNPRAPLGRVGLYIRREAQRRLRRRPKDWGPSSGRLSKSLAMLLDAASVTVGSNLVYAAIQQLGGEVRPKQVYLAIPVLPHLRRRGVWPRDLPSGSMRFHPAMEIKIGSSSWVGPALIRRSPPKTKDAKGRRKQDPRGGEVMFALLKSVKIKGRPYLVWDDAAQAFALKQFEMEYLKALRAR